MNSEIIFNSFQAEANLLRHHLEPVSDQELQDGTRNRFKVEQLEVIFCWGKLGTIPETVTVNLSKSTVWSLGSEVTVSTEEDEVIAFEEGESCF